MISQSQSNIVFVQKFDRKDLLVTKKTGEICSDFIYIAKKHTQSKELPMKIISIILSIAAFATLNTYAEQSPIPQEKLQTYKDAALVAINAMSLTCKVKSGSYSYDFSTSINTANSAYIETSDHQPLLVFSTMNADLTQKTIISISTFADYKSIIYMSGEIFNRGKVNLGDLKNPEIVDGYVSTGSFAECN